MITYSPEVRARAVRFLPRSGVETLRRASLLLLALGIGTSSFTFNWVVSHDTSANFFPEFAGSVVYLSDIFVVSGLIIWFAYRKIAGQLSKYSTGPLFVLIPLLILTLVSIMSVSWAGSTSMAFAAATRRTYLLVLYLVIVNERHHVGVYMTSVIIMGALLHGLVAIAQVLNGSAIGVAGFGELTRGAFGYGDIGNPDGYGIGFNPNPVAVHIAIGTVITYALLLSRKSGQAVRLVLPILLVVAFLGTIYTGAKSAFLTMAIGLLIVTAIGWWSNAIPARRSLSMLADAMLLTIILGGIAFVLTPSAETMFSQLSPTEYMKRQSSAYETSVDSRIIDYSFAMPIIKDNIIGGVGAGNYPLELKSRVAPDVDGPIIVPVHNVPLLIQAELGVIGSAAWFAFFFSPLLLFVIRRDRRRRISLSLIWLGPLVIVMSETLVDFTPWATQDGRLLFIAVVALWAGHYDRGKIVHMSWRASSTWLRERASRLRSVSSRPKSRGAAIDA